MAAGRGCKPALQDLKREPDVLTTLVIALRGEPLGPVHFLANVRGDLGVERGLSCRKFVFDGIGPTLGEQRLAVELEQLLLGEPAQQVRDVRLVHAVPEAALEAIRVEQRHEELEVLLFAVVRCGRRQQKVSATATEELSELVAFGVLHLAPVEARRHAVGLVAYDQVPLLRRSQLGLKVRIAGKHV